MGVKFPNGKHNFGYDKLTIHMLLFGSVSAISFIMISQQF